MIRLRAYECTVAGTDWHRTVHATTRGKAKSEYWRAVREPWPDVPFTAVKVKSVGPPVTSDDFRRTAAYRGLPNVRVGQPVRVDGHNGVIAGSNSSANFVLFEDGPNAGHTLNCHPQAEGFEVL